MKGPGGPGLATAPRPADEAVDVARDVVLGWTPGELAATHDVYFGTTLADVNSASRTNAKGLLASQGQTDVHLRLPPGSLPTARPTTGGSMRSTRRRTTPSSRATSGPSPRSPTATRSSR